MNRDIEKAIIKYITKSATVGDLDLLSKWIKQPGNKKIFKAYVQTHYAITYSMNNPDTNKLLERLLKEIRKEKSLVHKIKNQPVIKYAAAALLAGIMTTTIIFRNQFFKDNNTATPENVVNTDVIKPGTDKATLTLEDGSQIALEKGTSVQIQNAISNGEKIVYDTKKKVGEIKYNYLTIPRGGQFFIELSDGTKVWLNSESQLKYPVAFLEGETRKVELVYGEAYFDVSPSTEHQGSKFEVFNKSQEIQVIGTEFNVKAYNDEDNIYTTLVTGVVEIKTATGEQRLNPHQQSDLNLKNNSLKVSQVNVDVETSWRKGIFSFRDKSLKDIMKVLSRWYDVNVVFENKELESLKFKGSLEKTQSIEEILSIMRSTTINNYRINNKTIIIN